MAQKTPPLHARGVYQLKAPWSISSSVLYECIAIRSFQDFKDKGEDVFKLFYEPKALTREVYEADRLGGANIITLISGSLPVIHVPDTYIDSFPIQGNVAYKSVVLSVALGPLPNSTDLTFLKNQVSGVVSDVIGVTSEVKEHAVPNNDVITPDQATALETARQATISNRKSDYAKVLELQAQLSAVQSRLAICEQIIIDNNLLPPP